MKLHIYFPVFALIFFVGMLQSGIANHSPKDSTKNAQDDSAGERIYTVGLDYGSNQSFRGRNTGQKQPYYSPNFNYQAKSGFYFYASLTNILVSKADTTAEAVEARKYKVDEWQISPGYYFKIDKKTKGSISFTHYFIKDTLLITSGIKNNIDYSMDRDFKYVNEKLSFDLDLGDETDFGITLETYHSFDIENLFTKDNDILSIIPGFTFTAGTQNFYTTKIARQGKGLGKGKPPVTTTTKKFSVIAFDFSIPLSYSIGKFTFEGAYNYTAALNQPKEPGVADSKPFGYATAAISFDF